MHAQDSCACTRFLCMHKIPVHAQDSCACTRFLCMHKILMHAQDSRACTQDSCARTRILSMHKCCLNYSVNRILVPARSVLPVFCRFYVFDYFFCIFVVRFVFRILYLRRHSLDETDRSAHPGSAGVVMKSITSSNGFPRWAQWPRVAGRGRLRRVFIFEK